ncbi:hypothetical protein PAECIP111893_02115 [Paenibacillus plantiphilus]|uniref:Uncharacterized protein n=1 Tax=Paenibacillus plantiphilus TaxID=2905650 RepID=A0ABM9C4F9_9BACL|nr:hypothetical protein PAECIP111893_02115 [Paenibacillus plantiphilus]
MKIIVPAVKPAALSVVQANTGKILKAMPGNLK